MTERLRLDRVIKAREFFMAPWNKQNAFVILWGYGDGSNAEENRSEGAQNQISFANTEKCQIDAIAGILDIEDRIYTYQPEDPKRKIKYSIRWSDQILSDYLNKMGFRIRKTNVGAMFPKYFPNELMDIGAYGFWLSNGGITRHENSFAIYFFASEEFLTDFQIELEKHVNFPLGIGNLREQEKTLEDRVNLWILEYNGIYSYRILSAMFKRTTDICWSEKRDKAIQLVSNYTNSVLNRRDKAKRPKIPPKVKIIVALYDAIDLMDGQTRQRYLDCCDDWIADVRRRAEENWYLKKRTEIK